MARDKLVPIDKMNNKWNDPCWQGECLSIANRMVVIYPLFNEQVFSVCHWFVVCKMLLQTTCKGFTEMFIVNESDVKQTKEISNKPLSIFQQNWLQYSLSIHKFHSGLFHYSTCKKVRISLDFNLKIVKYWMNTNTFDRMMILEKPLSRWLSFNITLSWSNDALKCQSLDFTSCIWAFSINRPHVRTYIYEAEQGCLHL